MNAMQLWHVPLDIGPAAADRAARVLDPGELERAARMRNTADRCAFVAAHAALRGILGEAVGLPPQALVFERGPLGKPFLAAGLGGGEHRFNLSHSGASGLVAVARGREIGVDLEGAATSAQALDEVEDLVFSMAEKAAITACEPSLRPRARLRCWVRKEALLKAAGCGLSDAVRDITVSVGPEARLLASAHPGVRVGGWALQAIEGTQSWVGALAAEGADMGPVRVHHWSWPA
jgi:4'-phosphopantetheinyl transferase